MSIYYSKLNWPTLSTEFHNELLAHARVATNVRAPGRGNDNYHHYHLPEHIEKWCRDHLPITDQHHIRIQRFFGTPYIIKHIDGKRVETFNYVLSPTGPVTRWFDKDKIVESVVFPEHEWYRLKVDAMHDVIHLNPERIAITIHIPTA